MVSGARPRTRAAIDTITSKRTTCGRAAPFVPTWTAFAKVQLLDRYFAHLIDYEFTATMEEALDSIAVNEWLHAFSNT